VALEQSVDALITSALWRPVGLELLRGACGGWTASDLARWLLGPYQEATLYVPRSERKNTRARKVDAREVQTILRSARAEVVALLRDARWGGGPEFVRTAIRDRAIVPTSSGLWIPLDKSRMLLKDRVLALFAADYLLRPQDYVGDLIVCSKCEEVVFDPAARQTGYCGAHRISGLFGVKAKQATLMRWQVEHAKTRMRMRPS